METSLKRSGLAALYFVTLHLARGYLITVILRVGWHGIRAQFYPDVMIACEQTGSGPTSLGKLRRARQRENEYEMPEPATVRTSINLFVFAGQLLLSGRDSKGRPGR